MAAVGLAVAGIAGIGLLTNEVNAAQDCDDNAIIKCGFPDAAGFQSDYNLNVTKDLHTLYADSRFNFTADEMSRFMSTAKWGWSHKDGRITLDDGRVVATNAWSIGRQSFGNPNRKPITIGGTTYYWSYLSTSFVSGTTQIRTLVMMDTNNKYMEFAVMAACGNPTTGTKPTFQCEMLNKEQVSDKEFKFWTDVTAKDGATVKSVKYDFGDGKTESRTNAAEKVSHTYDKADTYHVTVTVTYTVNGVEQTETVQVKCKTDVTVKEKPAPVFECTLLDGKLIEGKRKYAFTATGHFENGAKLVSASFDFGDGQSANNVTNVVPVPNKPNDATITAEHKYADTLKGKVTITADLKFNIGTDVGNKKCTKEIELKEHTCADKPNAPECQPPKTCEELGNCKKILPSTGPEDTLLGAIAAGSFTGAGLYYRAARRNLMNNIFKR